MVDDLIELVTALAEVGSDSDALSDEALELLRDFAGADRITYIEVTAAPVSVRSRYLPDPHMAPEVEAALADTIHQHPLLVHYAATRDGRTYRVEDVVDAEAFHQTDLYRQYWLPQDLHHQAAFSVPAGGPVMRAVAVSRSVRRAPFTAADCAGLDLVRPHIAAMVTRLERRSVGSGAATASPTVLGASRREVLDRALVHQLSDGADDGVVPQIRRWQEVQTRRRSTDPLVVAEPLVIRREDTVLVVDAIPGPGDGPDLLSVMEHEATGPPVQLRGFGLTEREAEVVGALVDGSTNVQIGRRLGISAHTVRKHLENAYAKLRVENRTQAAALTREMLGW